MVIHKLISGNDKSTGGDAKFLNRKSEEANAAKIRGAPVKINASVYEQIIHKFEKISGNETGNYITSSQQF